MIIDEAVDHVAQLLKDQFNDVPEDIRKCVDKFETEAETQDGKWKITMSIEPIR